MTSTVVEGTALDDLYWLRGRTADPQEYARIDALMATLEHQQAHTGEVLGSSFTIGFMTLLERERQRQHRSAAV